MTAQQRSLPLVALVLGAAILVVQIRVIAGGKTWEDVRYHTAVAPPRLAAAAAVWRGELPQWWDGSGLGVTLAGEPSHGALDPLHWLAVSPRALDLLLIAHLAWAALGVAVWARRRASDRSALVAGLLMATTGIVMSAALRGALPGLAHVPWLGAAASWLAEAAGRRERSRAALAVGVLIAAIALAGELAVLVDAVAIALVLGTGRRGERPVGWLVAAIAAGLAIGALQWLPAALQLPDEAGAQVAGLPLARLVELIVPAGFGGGLMHGVPAIAGASPWAPSLFVGAPLLALGSVRSPGGGVIGLLIGLVAAALLAARGGWPAWLGAPELHVAVLAMVMAAAAGRGLDELVDGQRSAVLALAAGAGLSLLALASLAALRAQQHGSTQAIDAALLDGALGVACTAGAAVLAWRTPGRYVAVLFALLVAPGAGASHALAPTIDRAVVTEPPPLAEAARSRSIGLAPMRSYRSVTTDERPTVEDAMATFIGGAGWRWGIAAARSEDPARSSMHDRVWLAAAHEGGALLDRYGIALPILPTILVGPRGMTALGRRGSQSLVELPVAPAASVMRGWRWAVDPTDSLALLFPAAGGTGVPRGTVVLGGAGPAGPTASEPLACPIRRWRDGDIELACRTDALAYAVVSSSAAAGWSVTVDGQEAPWLAADVLRRAVAIPAGSHIVHWTYTLPGLFAGSLAALAGIVGLLALAVVGHRRARRTSIVSDEVVPGEIVSGEIVN